MTAHTLVDRRPDVDAILQDIKALRLSVDSNACDDYDIAHMPDYFNDWWKESLGSCRVSDMLPKSSIKDVMDLVEFHCSQLVSPSDHVNLCRMLTTSKIAGSCKVRHAPIYSSGSGSAARYNRFNISCAVPQDANWERVAGYVTGKDEQF